MYLAFKTEIQKKFKNKGGKFDLDPNEESSLELFEDIGEVVTLLCPHECRVAPFLFMWIPDEVKCSTTEGWSIEH